jgi:hypothetical protein
MTKQTKFRLAVATFGAPFLVATIAMFTRLWGGVAEAPSFEMWQSFVQVQAPLLLGLYGLGDVAHKVALAKATPPLPKPLLEQRTCGPDSGCGGA